MPSNSHGDLATSILMAKRGFQAEITGVYSTYTQLKQIVRQIRPNPDILHNPLA